jgi:hypothetical protein
MTLLALLFAFSPSLEALACAAEGCDPACAERSEATMVSGADKSTSDNCIDSNCVCVSGHCSHAAVSTPVIETSVALIQQPTRVRVEMEAPVFKAPSTPERPPRI